MCWHYQIEDCPASFQELVFGNCLALKLWKWYFGVQSKAVCNGHLHLGLESSWQEGLLFLTLQQPPTSCYGCLGEGVLSLNSSHFILSKTQFGRYHYYRLVYRWGNCCLERWNHLPKFTAQKQQSLTLELLMPLLLTTTELSHLLSGDIIIGAAAFWERYRDFLLKYCLYLTSQQPSFAELLKH